MKKILLLSLVILIVLAGVVVAAKNLIIRQAVQIITQRITGLSLRIQDMDVGFLNGSVVVQGMTLFNPPNYPDRVMMDLPLIAVDYDLASFGKNQIHLEEAKIHLKEFMVVKNQNGQLNINALKTVEESRQKAKAPPEAPPREKAKMPSASPRGEPNLKIDRLELSIGKVIYKDYSQGEHPLVREFPINLKERYSNITDPSVLVHLIVVRALVHTTVARLAGFDLNLLKDTLKSIKSGAFSVMGGAAGGALETIKKSAEDIMGIFRGSQ